MYNARGLDSEAAAADVLADYEACIRYLSVSSAARARERVLKAGSRPADGTRERNILRRAGDTSPLRHA